ncbi:MAG: glycerophosphodiester phosphodiesterase [Syntrophobacteraceae bacterium]
MAQNILDSIQKRGLIVAHRGARSVAPENTLAAARLGHASGARMWEIDVRLSSDGVPVLIHDSDLQRISDAKGRFPGRGPWLVDDFSLQELKELDFGSWFQKSDPFGQIAAGRVPRSQLEKYRGEPVATLEEAIRFTVENDWLLNIEIKDLTGRPGDETVVERVVSLVRSAGAVERVLVSSFNYSYLAQVKKLDGQLKTGVLTSTTQPDPVGLLRELGAFTFNPSLRAFSPIQARRLRRKGFGVLVWVVNNSFVARGCLAMGADGIFTDFPRRFS